MKIFIGLIAFLLLTGFSYELTPESAELCPVITCETKPLTPTLVEARICPEGTVLLGAQSIAPSKIWCATLQTVCTQTQNGD